MWGSWSKHPPNGLLRLPALTWQHQGMPHPERRSRGSRTHDQRSPGQELLTPAEAAEALHVTVKTITRWADDGALPVVRTLGGHRRNQRAAVELLAMPTTASRVRERPYGELASLKLQIPVEQLDWLTTRAARNGETMSEYVSRVVESQRRREESRQAVEPGSDWA